MFCVGDNTKTGGSAVIDRAAAFLPLGSEFKQFFRQNIQTSLAKSTTMHYNKHSCTHNLAEFCVINILFRSDLYECYRNIRKQGVYLYYLWQN
ncbi:MAG: hypothetical protein II190_03860, partial [Ruminococcus sp.]|nr:hypothetical protein [Ruminococcus sp.]